MYDKPKICLLKLLTAAALSKCKAQKEKEVLIC